MNKTEKLKLALNHKEGPIPFDLGATAITGMHVSIVEKLREYYGLSKKPVMIIEPLQLLGEIDDELKQAIGVDTDKVWAPSTIFGFKNEGAKEWIAPWGQNVLVPTGFVTKTDEKGDTYLFTDGDTNYAPSGLLPKGGYFFDVIVRNDTFDEDNPNVADNLEEFGDISLEDLQSIKAQTEACAKKGYGAVGSFGGTAIGDMALVTGAMLKEPKGLRDVAGWYMASVANQDYLHEIFSAQVEIGIKNLEKIHKEIGDSILAVYTCGTDFGMQSGLFCSVDTFKSLYKPYYLKVNNWIHKNTGWKTFKHCCGSVKALIPEIIDSGFDILNPVQWTAQNMDAKELKRDFGKDIVFWGGGVNTQQTFPFGTPKQVREEVLNILEIFGKDGGFVFNAIHNIQAKTPIENVVAFIDALKEFNGE